MLDQIAFYFRVNKNDYNFFCTYFWAMIGTIVSYLVVLASLAYLIFCLSGSVSFDTFASIPSLTLLTISYWLCAFVLDNSVLTRMFEAIKPLFVFIPNQIHKSVYAFLNKFCRKINN